MVVGRGIDYFVHAVYRKPGGHGWIVEVEILPPGTDAASIAMTPVRPSATPFRH
jgi:hypothetical protein